MSHQDRLNFQVGNLIISSGNVDVGNTNSVVVSTLPSHQTLSGMSSLTLSTVQTLSRFLVINPMSNLNITTPTAS